MPNRLADETSAYLRQHCDNPVDWYPWGPEPWERARRENRPVLVSIGYASCHWCHVMEHESFADAETAALMNQELVSIKVDREERPDVDQIYMETVVRLTGSGGWPLNVFCTPDGRPFFGGTYFPPERAHGRSSWRELVTQIARLFRDDPERVEEHASRILSALTAPAVAAAEPDRAPGTQDLHRLCVALLRGSDRENGGFGDAPKFPTPTNLDAMLLAEELRIAPAGTLDQVLLTLRRMARGGIFDQLGGGFHRYSTDARWAVPHFEKMLYDQGQLLRCYAEAYRQTRDPGLEWPVAETIAWLEREGLGEDGGPFASLDADSEGREGSFYVWSPDEIAAVLGEQRGQEFCLAYGVTRAGNFEATGKSVLAHGLAGERPHFADARAELLEARSRRVRPATDRKHITAWIGYAIGGLATAGAAFERRDWVGLAARSADFVLAKLTAPGLLRIYDGSTSRVPGFLDDHAGMLAGLLDLFRAGGNERYLEAAIRIAESILERFHTTETGEFFFAPADSQNLPLRPRSDPDGATPASSGLALLGLVRLASLTGRRDFASTAAAGLAREGPEATRQPVRFPTLLRAAALHETSPSLCLILGDPESAPARALAERARARLGPDAAVIVTERNSAPGWLDAAWLEDREPLEGRPTAWLCRGRSCSLPATDPSELCEPPAA